MGGRYHEVFVHASLEEVIRRDVKGIYKKALNGEINNFIGVDPGSPYEPPSSPELILDTEAEAVAESIQKVIDFMRQEEQTKETYDHEPA